MLRLDLGKQLPNRKRNETISAVMTFHRMRLPRRRLAICKDSLIDSIHRRMHNIVDLRIKDLPGAHIISEDSVELKHFFGPFVHDGAIRHLQPQVILVLCCLSG